MGNSPVAERGVINASPLIFLSRAHHLDLLHHVVEHVLVLEPVAAEIRKKGASDITVKAIESGPWMEIVPTPIVPDMVLQWSLGPGESSVLALASSDSNLIAIIDDLAGRRCAASLGIPVRGTLGIVLIAKKQGFIKSARSVMEDLIRAGLYLSPALLDAVLERAGE